MLSTPAEMDNPTTQAIVQAMDMQDLVIVGGGLNGPALALAAAQAGLRVTIVDRLPAAARADAGFDGRSYALALSSKRLLGAIGIWKDVAAQAQPISKVIASDGRPGEGASPLLLDLDAAEVEEGPFGYMLEDRFLRPALLTALAADVRITQLAEADVIGQSVESGHARVHLANGDSITASLIVGADGRRSGTAERAGIGRMGWEYGQTALVCAVNHARPHEGIAHQFFMPAGPLAILPLPGNRASIVWSERTAKAEELAKGDDAAFLLALRPAFGDFLGEISLAGARWSYPLNLTMAKSTVAGRVALIGDAAQGVHPIAGQGLNQGLRDVGTLAQVLADARRRGEDIGSPLVLERYRAWRSFDRAALALATDTFNRLFSNDNPLLRLGRDLGMAAVTAAPGLRRRFMREAAGLTGDVPRLLQGQPA